MWATISSALGVVGGVLSLWLAVQRILETRPVIVLEWVVGNTGHPPSFRLRIRNTSRYPIHISEVRPRLPRNEPAAFERIWCSDWELRDYLASALSRRLDVYLAKGQEMFIMFTFQEEVSHLLLTVS
jgi:hypothetical protein